MMPMTRTEHLLVILMEEAAEVAQRASKALRFGLAEVEPGQPRTNAQRIMDEVNDLVAVYQMLTDDSRPLFRGDPAEWRAAVQVKREKVEAYLRYSRDCGTLSDEEPA